jgi:hypothetical protein
MPPFAETIMRRTRTAAAFTIIAASITIGADTATAETLKKLSGSQIRATISGMQLSDEVHRRDVYERDGSLRSYSMGRKTVGKWFVRNDELCFDLHEPDVACFEVALYGQHLELKPTGLGLPMDGILQKPDD